MTPLYPRLLGEGFAGLHPSLREFHAARRGAEAAGVFRVTRPRGRLRNLLANSIGLPPAGEVVPLLLKVTPRGSGERWERSFGGHRLDSVQAARQGLLTETAGPASFDLAVTVRNGGMRFRTRRVWVLGIPVPRGWGPSVEAEAASREGGWSVRVRLRLPLLGELLSYEGHVSLRCKPR